jgi:hypothetical protein
MHFHPRRTKEKRIEVIFCKESSSEFSVKAFRLFQQALIMQAAQAIEQGSDDKEIYDYTLYQNWK